jgi:hypothetical protein
MASKRTAKRALLRARADRQRYRDDRKTLEFLAEEVAGINKIRRR